MTNQKEYPEVMTLAEAASYVRLAVRTVYGLAQRHEIPCAKLSTRWRFSKAALDAWLAGRAVAPAAREKK